METRQHAEMVERRIRESYQREKFFDKAHCQNEILADVHWSFQEEKKFLEYLEVKQQNDLSDKDYVRKDQILDTTHEGIFFFNGISDGEI